MARRRMWSRCASGIEVVLKARRNTATASFLLEAFTLCYSFAAGAFWSNPPSLWNDPWGLLRMAIPASAALFGLLLRNAYATPAEIPGPKPALVDGLAAVVCAFLSQQVLAKIAPELALPHWAPTQGGVWGLEFLVVVRHLLPPAGRLPDSMELNTLEELPWRMEAFGETFAGIRKGHLAFAVLLIATSAFLVCTTRFIGVRAGSALILLGAIVLLGLVRRRWQPRIIAHEGVPAWCSELKRQRRILNWIEWWYCLSLIPGILAVLFGSRLYAYLILLPVSLALTVVHLEAARRGQELGELELMKGSAMNA